MKLNSTWLMAFVITLLVFGIAQPAAAVGTNIDGSVDKIWEKLRNLGGNTKMTVTAQATEVTDTKIVYELKYSWSDPGIDAEFEVQWNHGVYSSVYACKFQSWIPGYAVPEDSTNGTVFEYDTGWPAVGKIPYPGRKIGGTGTNYAGGTASQKISFPRNSGKQRLQMWVVMVNDCEKTSWVDLSFDHERFKATTFTYIDAEVDTTKDKPDDGAVEPPRTQTKHSPEILKPNNADISYNKDTKKFSIPIEWLEPEIIRTDSNPAKKRQELMTSPNYLILQKVVPKGQSVGDLKFFNQLPIPYSEVGSGTNKMLANHSYSLNPGESTQIAFAVKANYKENTSQAFVDRNSTVKLVNLKVDEDGKGEAEVKDTEERPTVGQTEQGEGASVSQGSGKSDCKCEKVENENEIQKIIEKAICNAICVISKALGNVACFLAGNVVDPLFGGDGRQSCTPDTSGGEGGATGGAGGGSQPSSTPSSTPSTVVPTGPEVPGGPVTA